MLLLLLFFFHFFYLHNKITAQINFTGFNILLFRCVENVAVENICCNKKMSQFNWCFSFRFYSFPWFSLCRSDQAGRRWWVVKWSAMILFGPFFQILICVCTRDLDRCYLFIMFSMCVKRTASWFSRIINSYLCFSPWRCWCKNRRQMLMSVFLFRSPSYSKKFRSPFFLSAVRSR